MIMNELHWVNVCTVFSTRPSATQCSVHNRNKWKRMLNEWINNVHFMNPNPQPPLSPVSSLTDDSSVRVRSAGWPGKCHLKEQFKTDKQKCTYRRTNPMTLKLFWWRRCWHFQSKVNSSSRRRAMVLVTATSQESGHLRMCLHSSPHVGFHDHNTIAGGPHSGAAESCSHDECAWRMQIPFLLVTRLSSYVAVPFLMDA